MNVRRSVILALLLVTVNLYFFAVGALTKEGCEKEVMSVAASIEILPYTETNTVTYTDWLVPKKDDPIEKVLSLNTGKLVKIATLEVNLNFKRVAVYVNVNRKSIMRFVENTGINSNGEIIKSVRYGEDVYFVVSSKMKAESEGRYYLEVNVEMLNSKARQWALSFKYAVPIEFTLLKWSNLVFATSEKYEPYRF